MLILGRVYWFINWAAITATTVIIVLLVLRLIAKAADLNPFGWASITIRRLTEPLLGPVRRALTRMAVDRKYAPVVAILVAILLCWFFLQLISALANTVAGIIFALNAQAFVPIVGYLLYGLLGLYSLAIFVRIVLLWGMLGYSNRLMRFLTNITEPLLAPLRRRVPLVGPFDISPIVAFIIVYVLQLAVAKTLLHDWPILFFA